MKHKIRIIALISLLLTYGAQAHYNFDTDFTPEDIFEIDEPLLDDITTTRSCTATVPPEDILTILTGPDSIHLDQALKNNAYLHTNDLNWRTLWYLPALELPENRCERWNFDTQLFYNYLPRQFFTYNSPYLKDYVDLDSPDILEELDISALTNIDVPEVLGLFQNIKLYSHRIGFMFNGQFNSSCWSIKTQVPFYYLINHFYLTNEEISNITNAPLFEGAGSSGTDPETFVREHLVSDKIGFGDFRITALYNMGQWDECASMQGGLFLTIPSACDVKSGIIGGVFDKTTCPPGFSLQQLFDLQSSDSPECEQAALTIVENFGIGALNTLTAACADAELGQDHAGIGPLFTYSQDLVGRLGVRATAMAEYLIPSTQVQYFLAAKNPRWFDRDYANPATAQENLDFLNQQLINTLYPKAVSVKVHPGAILYANGEINFNGRRVEAALGGDIWYHTSETFSCINSELYQVSKAIRPQAYQVKVFGRFVSYFPHCSCDLKAGFSFDVTLANKGIGRDYTAVFYIGMAY